MDAKTFGLFPAECRKEKNMTQAELAEKLSVGISNCNPEDTRCAAKFLRTQSFTKKTKRRLNRFFRKIPDA